MRNLEIKTPAADLAAVRRRAEALGAEPRGAFTQVDTFFNAPRGLLKLRVIGPIDGGAGAVPASEPVDRGPIENGAQVAPVSAPTDRGRIHAELIAYERPEVAGSRMSDYVVAPVEDPGRLKEALERSLGAVIEVRKQRELWMYGGTRIHLDRVEGLGTFVELETEGNSRTDATMRAEHEEVIDGLGLDRSAFLAGSYAGMLRQA